MRPDHRDIPAFGVGLLSLSAQAVLLREILARGVGNEVVITLALALWLLGSALGGLLRRPRAGAFDPAAASARLIFGAVVSIAAFLAARFVPLMGAEAGEMPGPAAVMLLAAPVLLPASFATAGFFGVAAAGRPPGRAYACEAAGAICAGAATTALLVLRVEPLTILALALAAAILLGARRRTGAAIAAAILAAASVGWIGRLDDSLFVRAWEIHHPGLRVVDHAITPARSLVLAEREGERWLFCDGAPREVIDDAYGSESMAAAILSAAPRVRAVALVDFGSAGTAAALVRAGAARVVCLLPEPEDTLLAPVSRGVEVVIGDPRRTMTRLDADLDAIVLSGGAAASLAANRLWTAEAFGRFGRKLAPAGVVVAFTPGGAAASLPETREWRNSIASAMRERIGPVAAIDADRFVLSAGREEAVASWSADSVAARFARNGSRLAAYSPERLAVELPPERIRDLDAAETNRDARPAAIEAALARWARQSGWDGPIGGPVVWVLAAVLLAVPLLGRRGTGALVATGAASMGLDLVVLVAYQCRVGMLPAGFGILSGAFFGGMAAGALLSERRGAGERALLEICAAQSAVILAAGFLAPRMPEASAAVGTLAYAAAAFVAGLFCGLPFPIVARRQGSGAAWAADAAGGIAGAVVVFLLAARGMAVVGAALAIFPLVASSRLLGSRGRRSGSALL